MFVSLLLGPSYAASDREKSGPTEIPSHKEADLRIGDLFAVVVGVSKYKDPGITAIDKSAKDAEDFAKFLKTQNQLFKKSRVELLLNEKANRAEVAKQLYYGLRRAGKNDTVILFFSGHGAEDPYWPGQFFLMTYDTAPDNLQATALEMTGMKFLQRLDSDRILVIVDTCHPDVSSPDKTKRITPSLKKLMIALGESSGKVMITSSKDDEQSVTKSGLANSLFTHHLIEGLKGAADRDGDGAVTVNEAYRYSYKRTTEASGGLQHPQFAGRVVGSFPVSYVGKLLPTHATLELATDLPGVEVRLDGKRVGDTQSDGRLVIPEVRVGAEHEIEFRKKGYRRKTLVERIPDGYENRRYRREERIVLAKLPERSALDLPIVTDPPGVEIYVDNGMKPEAVTDASGRGRLKVGFDRSGKVFLRFRKENYAPHAVRLTRENTRTLPKIVLKRTKANLRVKTRPGLVAVTVAGAYKGRTDGKGDLIIKGVTVGAPLEVTFKRDGYGDVEKHVKIAAVDTFAMNRVKLKRLETRLELSVDQPGASVYVKRKGRFERVGKTDRRGRVTIKDLLVGQPVEVKMNKAGWRQKVIGPLFFSKDNLRIKKSGIKLAPALASLRLQTSPARVNVKIDGKRAGTTGDDGKFVVGKVQVGVPHKIALEKEGYKRRRITLRIPVEKEGGTYSHSKVSLVEESRRPAKRKRVKRATREGAAGQKEGELVSEDGAQIGVCCIVGVSSMRGIIIDCIEGSTPDSCEETIGGTNWKPMFARDCESCKRLRH